VNRCRKEGAAAVGADREVAQLEQPLQEIERQKHERCHGAQAIRAGFLTSGRRSAGLTAPGKGT
jgi:hypothetical protein